MAKTPGKDIVERVRRRQKQEAKANVTFRLNIELMDRFRHHCGKQNLAMAAILEELIEDFLK